MIIVTKYTLDLTRKSFQQYVHATQNDSNTRAVEITLLANGEPWNVPAGVIGSVSFKKPDKTGGIYDTLPDGITQAVKIQANKVTAILAPQALTVPGDTQVSVSLHDSNLNRLNTFPFVLRVDRDPAAGVTVSEDYYWVKTLAAIGDLSKLSTTAKNSLVEAINELYNRGSSGGNDPGQDGEDGFSPIATVTQTAEGATISITDKNGTTTATVTNGKDGEDGDPGRGIKSIARTSGNGAAGTVDTYTITYTDNTKSTFAVRNGANGTNGIDGDDGITPHIGSNGSWYIGSTDTGIKAQGEQGPKGDTGTTGPKGDTGATGSQGPKGADGANGKTPVRGTDYWTPADQEAIVQQVIAALGTPVFGRVDADNNIILTGELADGTYTLKYEDGEGNVTEIGTLTQGGSGPAYTNLLPTYLVARDARYSSSAEPESHQKACPGAILVAIPFGMMMGKTLRIKSPSIDKTSADGKPTSFNSVSYLGSFNGYVFNSGDSALAYAGCAVNEGNNTYSFLFTDENVTAAWDPDSTMYATIIVNTAGTAVTDEELNQVVITLDEPIV